MRHLAPALLACGAEEAGEGQPEILFSPAVHTGAGRVVEDLIGDQMGQAIDDAVLVLG